MKRREFIAGLGGGLTLAARAGRVLAQAPPRRVAWLGIGSGDRPSPYVDALRAGLSEHGWVEGRNLALSLYWAHGREDMEGVARALLATNPEVVVTQELMVYAIQPLQPAMPVVFGFSGDPVDGKLVDGLARPGRNFTGMSYLALALVGKRIEFLKEWLPQLQHVAILAQPQHPGEQRERQASEEAVAKLGLSLSYYPIAGIVELDNALAAIQRDACDALVVFPDSTMLRASERIARFAIAAKLPSVSGWAPFAASGLLLTYGPNIRDLYRSLARYVDRILRGARAADLPVELPSTFELVINTSTAKAIGLSVPPNLLARADEVIE
jgi:putative tryptophan/tyrosine transport system substrate-binding protein